MSSVAASAVTDALRFRRRGRVDDIRTKESRETIKRTAGDFWEGNMSGREKMKYAPEASASGEQPGHQGFIVIRRKKIRTRKICVVPLYPFLKKKIFILERGDPAQYAP